MSETRSNDEALRVLAYQLRSNPRFERMNILRQWVAHSQEPFVLCATCHEARAAWEAHVDEVASILDKTFDETSAKWGAPIP